MGHASRLSRAGGPVLIATPGLLGILLVAATAIAQPSPSPSPALTLPDAIRLALAKNERIAIAAAERGQVDARLSRARAFFFPELVATGNLTRRARAADRSATVYGAALNASVPLFDARSFPLYRQARLERDAARIDEREARRLLAFEVADAYLQTLGQEQVVAAAIRRRDLATLRLEDARGRAGARLVGGNDVTLAELEAATAERERIDAETDLAAAYQGLSFLIGADVAGPLAAPGAVLAGAAAPPGEDAALVAGARTGRRDLEAARLRVLAARESAKEPGRRSWPVIDLGGQVAVSSETGLSGENHDWLIGLGATWVLWDGGENRAEARERSLAAEAAALGVKAQERQIATEVRTAAITQRGALAAQEQAVRAAAAARKNSDEVGILYRQGLARAIEVADAGGRLFEAEVALARAEVALGLAYLDVLAASGQDPVTEVSP
jgi:outer membrane protein TolC